MKGLNFADLQEIRRQIFDLAPRDDTLFGSAGLLSKARRVDPEFIGDGGKVSQPSYTIAGLRVMEIPAPFARRPVLQISPGFEHCSPEFRAEWNAWALERFGTEEVAFIFDSHALSRIAADLEKEIDKKTLALLRGIECT